MTARRAFGAARIFDGHQWHEGAHLLVAGGRVAGIAPGAPPAPSEPTDLGGGFLVPGLVDLQVNGGGGVLLNDSPTLEGIAAILTAHARLGTTALLPTLITDTVPATEAAIGAGGRAAAAGLHGFLGLHLEGPHLAISRKGAHDPSLIRPLLRADRDRLVAARGLLPNLLATLAPEAATTADIGALAAAGVVVSLGHSDASFASASAAFGAGARLATHLFNAMSPLGSREPGLVGATLAHGPAWAGLIADGIHVHPETIRLALVAKAPPGRIFLVSDAMSVAGTELPGFTLNGRPIVRAGGALRLPDGTLAGADLSLLDAVRFMHGIGLPLGEALRMGALYPAEALGVAADHGHLGPGARADFLHLADDLTPRGVWIGGEPLPRGPAGNLR